MRKRKVLEVRRRRKYRDGRLTGEAVNLAYAAARQTLFQTLRK